MAIRVLPTSSSLNTSGYLHGQDDVTALNIASPEGAKCELNLLGTCKRDVPAFAFLSDEADTYRNDFRSFIYQIPTGATITATLIAISPTGVETNYAITDNTYGQYFAVDSLKTGVWGFILKWYNVADVIGFGCYKVNILIENSSSTTLTDYTTPCFKLLPYTCQRAHRTMKVTTWQKGYIQNGFDYRGIDWWESIPGQNKIKKRVSWPQEIRWYGRFYPVTPTYQNETNQDKNRNEQQIQSQYIDNYNLRFDHLYSEIARPFFRDSFLSGEIYCSNYWYNDVEEFDHVRVNPLDITDRDARPMNANQRFEIELEDFNKATIKRH